MASSSSPRPETDPGALWRAAVRCLPQLVLLALALGGVVYAALGMVAPRYASEAQLAIEARSSANLPIDPSHAANPDDVALRLDRELIQTHTQAMLSNELAEAVVSEMRLAERAEFNSALGPTDRLSAALRWIGIGSQRAGESPEKQALDAFKERLEVESAPDSRLIRVRFTSIDPKLAAAVANRVAATYREHLARPLVEPDGAREASNSDIVRLAEEAAVAEAAVERFRSEAGIPEAAPQITSTEQQLTELNAELARATAVRREAEANVVQARTAQAQAEAGVSEAPADTGRPSLMQSLIQSRARVERQISELSAAHSSRDPQSAQLLKELEGLKSQIDAQITKTVEAFATEANIAALREETIRKDIAQLKARSVAVSPEAEAHLRSIEANARSKRAALDRMTTMYGESRIRTGTIPAKAHIISSARPAATPVYPQRTRMALLVAAAAFGIGAAAVGAHTLLSGASIAGKPVGPRAREGNRDRRRRARAQPTQSPGSVRRTAVSMSAPPPTHVPATPAPPIDTANPDPLVEEQSAGSVPKTISIDAAASHIRALRKGGQTGTRTMVTGAADVFSLANAAADLGRRLASEDASVILVDWSLNGTGIAEPLGAPAWPGFAELIDGRARFEDVVRALRDNDVHLIPCGRGLDDPEEPLNSDSLNFLLDALDDVYAHIVVVARTEPARRIFEAIQGRFDCGVTLVVGEAQEARLKEEADGSFLGFSVEGIALYAVDGHRPAPHAAAPGRGKQARAGRD